MDLARRAGCEIYDLETAEGLAEAAYNEIAHMLVPLLIVGDKKIQGEMPVWRVLKTEACAEENNLLVSDGISNGKTWATYQRKPSGSLRRVCSKHLPLRNSRDEAEKDLKVYIARHQKGRS